MEQLEEAIIRPEIQGLTEKGSLYTGGEKTGDISGGERCRGSAAGGETLPPGILIILGTLAGREVGCQPGQRDLGGTWEVRFPAWPRERE